MMKIKNKLILGLISGLLGELVIMMSNRLFVKFGLVKSSLNLMSLQVLKYKRLIPITTYKDKWLSYVISTFFCLSGSVIITFFLTLNKRLVLVKGFFLGALGGLIPYTFKQIKLIKDFKTPISKVMCLVSHGIYGLTVALTVKILGDEDGNKNENN